MKITARWLYTHQGDHCVFQGYPIGIIHGTRILTFTGPNRNGGVILVQGLEHPCAIYLHLSKLYIAGIGRDGFVDS